MTGPKEFELKFQLPAAELSNFDRLPMLRAIGAPTTTETAVSVYFDTNKRKLLRKGILLRVRRIGKRHIQTVKADTDGQLFERGEWESEIEGETPDLDSAHDWGLKSYLSRKLCRRIKPMFETRVKRRVYRLSDGHGLIEMSLDSGRIDSGRRSQPLCEIELELKRGTKEALFGIAREVVDALPAELALKSKSERGYALLAGGERDAAKATEICLQPAMSAADGFRAIGSSCLRQITDNAPALRAGDAEGVHQMRVGLRRLRAAISLFAEMLTDTGTAAVKRELKWLTSELAPARELEVLEKRVILPIKHRRARFKGFTDFAQVLAERRAAALERAKLALASPRFRRLLLDVAAWLETGEWSHSRNDLIRDRAAVPIASFAAEALDRRWRKVVKKGRRLRELDRRGCHKLRIQAKKLRYASQFFSGLFAAKAARKRRKRFRARLEALQDALGDLNDIAVHEEVIAANAFAQAPHRRRPGNRKRAFAAGMLAGREEARGDRVLDEAIKTCAELIKAKPFW